MSTISQGNPFHLGSDVLFAGNSRGAVVHGADSYHLRLTRQNRLILTK